MRLRLRLTLALAAIGLLTSLAVAVAVRGSLVAEERIRFEGRVRSVVSEVERALERRLAADKIALDRTCAVDPIVQRALTAAQARAELSRLASTDPEVTHLQVTAAQARAAVASGSTALASALSMDEVWILDARDGFVLAAPPDLQAIVGARDPKRQRLLLGESKMQPGVAVRRTDGPLLIARCTRQERGESVVVAALRKMDRTFFDRLSEDVRGSRVLLGAEKSRPEETVRGFDIATLPNEDEPEGKSVALHITVAVSGAALASAIARIDQVIVAATLISIVFGAAVGFMVSRRLVSPLGALESQARKVAEGTAEPVVVRGSDEVAALAIAFNTMLEDLETTRRRLGAAERVAAWREAARRIAHEIKNPLAPIRASIETLRRLRARDDPAFDSVFDEATRTVLEEVRRVTQIVDEFSRYARIAAPRPKDVDPVEIARHVVGLFANDDAKLEASDPQPRLSLVTSPCPEIRADREQLVQVLVNLVKNALESTSGKSSRPTGHVRVEVEPAGPEAVRFVVRDDGAGVDDNIAARLFEPYASNKKGGTGLGLAIAQRIAVEHGGAISYAKGPKGGAVFRVLLPKRGPTGVAEPETLRPRVPATTPSDGVEVTQPRIHRD